MRNAYITGSCLNGTLLSHRLGAWQQKRHTMVRSFMLLAVLSLWLTSNGQTTHHVNGDGLCGGDSPCYTSISAAVTAALNDDIVLVQPGTYAENVVVNKNIQLLSTGGADVTVIDGDDSGPGLGTVYLTTGRNGVVLGAAGQGFTILGLDNLNPGLEKAAVYLQGAQTNIIIEGNVIEARGDAAMMGEWNAANNGITINANQFTGQTFIGAEPATGNQFTVWNVARQAIVFGGGTGTSNTQNFTFTNNDIGTLSGANGIGNVLVTLDLVGTNVIEGNTFSGSSPVYALRVRGGGDYSINGNSFDGDYPIALFSQGNEIDATNNWWGTTDFNEINDLVVGDVTFSPALADGTDTDPSSVGFQPNMSSSQSVLPGCTNTIACNYDSNAGNDDGSCTYDCYGCSDTDPSATQDDGTCGLCYETEDFNGAITLAATQTPDTWYVDRWAPAGFISNASFDSGQRLRHIISEFDGGQYRGSQSSAFYDTQGRKYDLPQATNSIEIELYVPAAWETTDRRMAGIWGTAVNDADAITAYPIIEFASVDNNPRFRGWGPLGWFDLGLPAGFVYNQWYTLRINLLPNGEFLYTVLGGSAPLQGATNGYAAGNAVGITNVILQGHNTFDGVDYVIHWDNLTYGTSCSEFIGLTWEEVPGSTIDGYTTYRVYAEFAYDDDQLVSVYGVVDANETSPLSISTTGSFYQDPAGGSTANSVNPAAFAFLPDLEFDTWVTIGEAPQAQFVQVLGINSGNFTSSGLEVNDATGGLWFITPGSSTLAVAGNNPDKKILIGQFTTNGIVDMTLNLQFVGSNNVSQKAQQVTLSFPDLIEGCTDAAACNYNEFATDDDGTCVFPGCTDAFACNYVSAAGCDDGSCDYACLTAYYINDNDTTDDVFTSAIGDDSNTGSAASPFATFAHAISVASMGDTIYVDVGRYNENVIIDKGVVILGPNHDLNPNTDARIPEAVLHPATTGSYVYQIDVVANDVTIKGVTLDGDNPDLISGFTNTTGADIDAAAAIEAYEGGTNNLVVENNIIRNYFYFAVSIYPFFNGAGTPSSGHSISYNRFEDLGTYDSDYPYANWGGAVLIYNNAYTKIEHNVINNARLGIQTGNFSQTTPNPSFEHGIRNNEISSRRVGIFHNLAYSNAAEIPVSDNVITPSASVNEINWTGLSLSSLSVDATCENNTIDGSGSLVPTLGINVWNVSGAAPSTIKEGSITNVDTGIFLNNFEGYATNGNDGAHANISSVVIYAYNLGISLYDSPNYTGSAAAEIVANIQNCFITSENTGIALEEVRDGAVSATINENFLDADGLSIDASTIQNTVDATCNWFGSDLPSVVSSLVEGDVTFVPLLISGTDDQPGDPGFYPVSGACFAVAEGCTNPSACNYDSDATNDNGTCDYSCIICDNDVEEGVNATFAPGYCIGCDGLENFNAPITVAATQTPGAWYTDRYAPSVFAGAVSFLSGLRLRHIISEFDGGQYRPSGFAGAFYDTQGRKLDLPDNNREISIDLYVPAAWASTNRRMAGLWGTSYDNSNAIAGYPIIEYASVDSYGRFRTWDGDGTWTDIGLPDGFVYNSWVTLTISLLDNGQFLYEVRNATGSPGSQLHATSAMNGAAETIGDVILQGHNTFDGVSYVIHWDDFRYSHGKLGCTDLAACNYDPAATCDDNSCIEAIPSTSFAATLPGPVVVGSGIPNTNFVLSEDCNVNAAIKAFNRFVGDIVPVGPLYRAESGNSPTSAGDPTPVAGLARWNYLIAVDLGNYTFEDLNVFLDIDWDPAGSSVYTLDLSAYMISLNLGGTSVLQDSQNLGFGFWQTIGDPNILPFDPFANGIYDLAVRIETQGGDPVLSAGMNVEIYTNGCTDTIACNYDPNATDDDGSCDLISCADCAGVPNGTALVDDCNVCSGGTTGIPTNSTCLDCNGDVNGTASIDDCGVCSGGTTGIPTNSTCLDCNGDVNGTASIDDCGVCSGGNTGIPTNSTCLDCNGDVNGTAFIDDCGVCAGGNTANTPNSTCLDCAGVPNGTAFIDDCGNCVGGTTNQTACITCPGDFNQDGIVNTSDLTILLGNWGCVGPNCLGDMNNDQQINSADLTLFLPLFGSDCAD